MSRRSGQIRNVGEQKYFVRWFEGVKGGKRTYKSKRIHGTLKDAQRFLNAVLRSRDLNEYVEPSKLTLDAYLDQWLDKAAHGSSRSRGGARWTLAKYVRPQIGAIRLDRLTALDIEGVLKVIRDTGAKARGGVPLDYTRTIRGVIALLRRVLKQAVKDKKIRSNPANDVDMPKKTGREMLALTPEQVAKLREALRDSRHPLIFDVLLATGMRPGEVLALRWRDVDLKAGALTVQRALTYDVDADGKLTHAFREPKTKRSKRTIPLFPSLVRDLQTHRAAQATQALKLADVYDRTGDLVFANEIGQSIDPHTLSRYNFKPAVKRAGLDHRLRVYDLRHTHATLLLAAGENVKVVSERLGHASAAMTLDVYAHTLPGMQEQATRKIEAAIFGAKQ